jgi:predicted transcriptional regulator
MAKVILYMVSYRTSIQIVGDLLTATEQSGQEGIKTTNLLTKANLSHSRLSKFLSNLTGAGLINKIEYDGKNTLILGNICKICRCCRILWFRTIVYFLDLLLALSFCRSFRSLNELYRTMMIIPAIAP